MADDAQQVGMLKTLLAEARARAEEAERVLAGEREVIVALNRRAEAAEAEAAKWRKAGYDGVDAMAAHLSATQAQRDALAEALRAMVAAAERVEWTAFQMENDMALCVECGEGHHDHPDGGGHSLSCPLAQAMRAARAALAKVQP